MFGRRDEYLLIDPGKQSQQAVSMIGIQFRGEIIDQHNASNPPLLIENPGLGQMKRTDQKFLLSTGNTLLGRNAIDANDEVGAMRAKTGIPGLPILRRPLGQKVLERLISRH